VHGTSPETASTFSSGGFSNYWGGACYLVPLTVFFIDQLLVCIVADYQSDAVAAFLTAQGTTNSGLFNASGRGYPDVSAQGENVQIVSAGRPAASTARRALPLSSHLSYVCSSPPSLLSL
jgi:tripeptidyl-peptidase-1